MPSQGKLTITSRRTRRESNMSPTRHQPPRAIHNTQEFHGFMKLPNELQMQIWLHAVGSTSLHVDYIDDWDNNMPARNFPPKIVVQNFGRKHNLGLRDMPIVQIRNSLAWTCRLSRLMTLETWKSEISKVPIGAWQPRLCGWMSAMQSRKVKIADELIGMVKAYMEGRKIERVQIRQRIPLPE